MQTSSDFAAVNEVYRKALADLDDLPARMTYAAGGLPFGAKVEGQAVAVRSRD